MSSLSKRCFFILVSLIAEANAEFGVHAAEATTSGGIYQWKFINYLSSGFEWSCDWPSGSGAHLHMGIISSTRATQTSPLRHSLHDRIIFPMELLSRLTRGFLVVRITLKGILARWVGRVQGHFWTWVSAIKVSAPIMQAVVSFASVVMLPSIKWHRRFLNWVEDPSQGIGHSLQADQVPQLATPLLSIKPIAWKGRR